ncbi:uncharacterized protein LOC127853924 [Dreissena polymorpha]|uniref:uncharacterized protein LOC127853924 n=1 Tax=Dreissena polymorpha TaxID=45954 RepID=UPI0022647AB8|nr:uncharacterized protein LOC127853924 [Dreissena polymorpha]
MAEQQVQTRKVAHISVEEIDEHVVGDQNDVLSLNQDSEEEFSGFESDDVPRNISKEKTIGKTVKSVVKKVTSKDASGGKKQTRSSTKKPQKKGKSTNNPSCMVQIDLNNLSSSNLNLLKEKLGLSQPENSNDCYYDDYDAYENETEWDENVDIHTAPNLRVQVENDESEDDIGIIPSVRPKVKDMSKKLMNDLFGDNSDKENNSDDENEWKLPKIKKKSRGPPVSKSLAELMNTACTASCDTQSIRESHLVPENCDMMFPPSVNLEMWRNLDKRTRSVDRLFQDLQNLLAAGMVPVMKLAEMLRGNLPAKEQTKQLVSDSLTLLGQVQYNLSIRRRFLIRPNIPNKKYRALCNFDTPITCQLFGDDISKEMKNCDAGVMLSNSLRAYQNFSMHENLRRSRGRFPCNFRGRWRFMPYGNPHYGNPNFNT